MTKERSNQQNDALAELQQLLMPALTMLDLRGTDEIVSKALIIANEAFKSLQSGGMDSTEELYSRAMKIYEQEKTTEN